MVSTLEPQPKVVVDKEFAGLIPASSADELSQLEANILREGCIDALVVWDCGTKLVLLDGHQRRAICKKHGLGHRFKRLEFATRQEARNWIINHQLGRRNISEEQRKYLLGQLWRDAPKAAGGRPADKTSAMVAEVSEPENTAKTIADAHGVSERTVHNAAAFADAIDAIGDKAPELKAAILSGDAPASAADLERLADAPKRTVQRVAKVAAKGDAKATKAAIKEAVAEREPGDDTEQIEADKNWLPILQAPYVEAVKSLRAIKKTFKAEAEKAKDGVHLHWNRLQVDFDNLIENLNLSAPDAPCPSCSEDGARGDGCKDCRTSGFITKGVNKGLSRESKS